MKRSVIITWLLLLSSSVQAQLVMRTVLAEETPLFCPVSLHTTLTIHFPGELDALQGAGFTANPAQSAGDYLVHYSPGTSFLSLLPLSAEAPPRNLNLVLQGQAYVLIPFIVENPAEAWMVLTLEKPFVPADFQESTPLPVKRRKRRPKPPFTASSPARLVGLIDTMKLLCIAEPEQRSQLLEQMSHIDARMNVNESSNFGDYNIGVDHVIRHQEIDALCLALNITNQTDKPLAINPESFSVRVGTHVYSQAISDAPAQIGPTGVEKAYVVIAGNGEGGANWLSVNNSFQISLDLRT